MKVVFHFHINKLLLKALNDTESRDPSEGFRFLDIVFCLKFPLLFSRSGVGVTGSRQTLFYAEVTDQMRTSEGGGQPEEGELIEVVEIPLEDSMKFAYDEAFPKTMGVIFSFMWFQNNIAPKLPKK